MTPDTEKALRVARWCWPERQWGFSAKGEIGTLPDPGPDVEFNSKQYETRDDFKRMVMTYGIADAEAILIERGLAEQYGRELDLAIERKRDEPWTTFERYTALATAPLSARLDAMDAVIRSCAK